MRVCAGTGTLLISVEPGRLALAAAEDSAFAAELIDRLAGYDANLLSSDSASCASADQAEPKTSSY